MRVESLLIEDITVGERRREEFGDLQGLAESIGKYGLFHPVVVDGARNLIAGERRLRACRDVLGWMEIPCRLYDELSEDERREIELEENVRRKDLTPFEASRQLVKQAETVAPFISDAVSEKKEGETRGRKSHHEAPKEEIAKAIGVSDATLRRAEQHVEAVTKYPELSVVPTQKAAIDAAKQLDSMPERERQSALSRLASEGGKAVAAITGKKPSTSAPKPKPASGKYAANLSQIQVFISTVQSVGADELSAGWTEQETHAFLGDLREARDGIAALVADFEKAERERRRANEAA